MRPVKYRVTSQDGASETVDKFTSPADNSKVEEADHATPKARRGRPKTEHRGGLQVGAMKFPLKTALKEHLKMLVNEVGERTFDNRQRILTKLVEEIESGKVNRLSTTNPYKMTIGDAKAILDHLKKKELENETTLHYFQFFNGLLLFCNNRAIEDFMKKSPHQIPRRSRKAVNYLKESDLNKVREAAKKVAGWNGSVLRFLTAAYPGTGLRPSELRVAHIDDLDCRNWTLRVRHPKGEGDFGERRVVTIMPPFREDVLRYLEERDKLLQRKGRNSEYLIPNTSGDADKPYSANHFRVLKKELEEIAGINFRIKDFRSTFASLTIKKNPNLLPDVSKQLGHSSLVVTQTYYASIEASDAGRRLAEAWEQKPTELSTSLETRKNEMLAEQKQKNILIKPKEFITGYA